MLAPMPLASTLGVGGAKAHVITPMVLSRNGNAMTISNQLYHNILEQHQLSLLSLPLSSGLLNKEIIERKKNGKKLKFYPDDLKALASYMFANSKIQDSRNFDKATQKYSGGGILMQGLRCNDKKPGVDPWGRFYDDRKYE